MTEYDLASKDEPVRPMHSLRIALVVLFLLLLVSSWTNWYSGQVSMPRYCENIQETMRHLERILREPEPAGRENRQPYLVAAKLLFLLPRQPDEDIPAYLRRVESYIQLQCQ